MYIANESTHHLVLKSVIYGALEIVHRHAMEPAFNQVFSIASRLEVIATRLETIASRLEAIAIRFFFIFISLCSLGFEFFRHKSGDLCWPRCAGDSFRTVFEEERCNKLLPPPYISIDLPRTLLKAGKKDRD